MRSFAFLCIFNIMLIGNWTKTQRTHSTSIHFKSIDKLWIFISSWYSTDNPLPKKKTSSKKERKKKTKSIAHMSEMNGNLKGIRHYYVHDNNNVCSSYEVILTHYLKKNNPNTKKKSRRKKELEHAYVKNIIQNATNM